MFPSPDMPFHEFVLPAAEGAGVQAPVPLLPGHLLHFEPLVPGGAALDIPCDPQGRVRLDALGETLRNDYFFARSMVGRVFAAPTVRTVPPLTSKG